MRCSGIHRSLGSHISFVRSIDMDDWKPMHFENMLVIGNKKSNDYYECNKPASVKKPTEFDSAEMVKQYIQDKYVRRKYAAKGEKSPAELLEKERLQKEKKGRTVEKKKKKPKLTLSTTLSDKPIKVGKPVPEVHNQKTESSDEDGNYDLSDDDDFKPSQKAKSVVTTKQTSILSFNFSDDGVESQSSPFEEKKVNVDQYLITADEKVKKKTKKKKTTTKKSKKTTKKKNGMEKLESESESANAESSPYDFIFEDDNKSKKKQSANVSELTEFLSEIGPEAIPQKPLTIDEFEQQLKLNLQMEMFSKPSTPTIVTMSTPVTLTPTATTATTEAVTVESTNEPTKSPPTNEGRPRSASLISLGDKVYEDRIVSQVVEDDSEELDFSSDSEDEMFRSSKQKKKKSVSATETKTKKKKKKTTTTKKTSKKKDVTLL